MKKSSVERPVLGELSGQVQELEDALAAAMEEKAGMRAVILTVPWVKKLVEDNEKLVAENAELKEEFPSKPAAGKGRHCRRCGSLEHDSRTCPQGRKKRKAKSGPRR